MKATKITIPNPCSESWSDMDSQNNGRYCDSCSTVVRDFSKMSDTQLYYILQQSQGKICGRMNKSQLNRPLVEPAIQKSPDLLAVVLGLTLLMSVYPSYAQEERGASPEISLIEQLNEDSTKIDLGHDYIQMRFEFIDENTGEPIPFLKAIVQGEYGNFYAGAFSDFDGNAVFQLSPDQFDSADSLRLTSIDIGDVNLEWNKDWSKDRVNQILLSTEQAEVVIMMGAVVEVSTADYRRGSRQYKREMRRMKRQERRESN